ncbi:MAG: ornithine carbamoyltransferase [Deltaproteobacteria bacterium]|nr:ornithine carbamoyltransferase [Deltaproteobacteria bacterium]
MAATGYCLAGHPAGHGPKTGLIQVLRVDLRRLRPPFSFLEPALPRSLQIAWAGFSRTVSTDFSTGASVKSFLTILDLTAEEAMGLVRRAGEMKRKRERSDLLRGKMVALIFEKASTRTRVSFEVGIRHLGGDVIFLTPRDCQLGRSEPIRDTARVLARYVDGAVIRTFGQTVVEEFDRFAGFPVINALTDEFHPCQVMSDMLTMYERTPDLASLKVAWIGDGNNMAHSWINASTLFGFELRLATPKGYEPDAGILARARQSGAKVLLTDDPAEAVTGADYVNTDVWASMGQEEEQAEREADFAPFQVNGALMDKAGSGAKVLHCLPAHRGEEISEDVLEGSSSIVWDQAENRLHMQKAILEWAYTTI